MVFQSIATPSAELEYVSDHDGEFKQPLERCKLLNRWAFEYFDQTGWPCSCSESAHVFRERRLVVRAYAVGSSKSNIV